MERSEGKRRDAQRPADQPEQSEAVRCEQAKRDNAASHAHRGVRGFFIGTRRQLII